MPTATTSTTPQGSDRGKTYRMYQAVTIIQELKITEGEDGQSTMEWTTEREKKHHEWDNVIEDLDQHINQLRKDEDQQRKQEEIAIEEDRRSKRREEKDQWIEKQKQFHMELEEQKLKQLEAQQLKAKLPKLQLAKFDGTITDWVRFWEKFEEEIDKSKHYAAVTKFSYFYENF